jgi:hypothetical protein
MGASDGSPWEKEWPAAPAADIAVGNAASAGKARDATEIRRRGAGPSVRTPRSGGPADPVPPSAGRSVPRFSRSYDPPQVSPNRDHS